MTKGARAQIRTHVSGLISVPSVSQLIPATTPGNQSLVDGRVW